MKGMDKQLNNIFVNFESLCSIDLKKIPISYGFDHTSKIQIRKTNIDLTKFSREDMIWKVKLMNWLGDNIPFLFNEVEADQDVITSENSNAIINYDIIASSFFLLRGKQE